MIIDCHGHYTTAPASHAQFRERQLTALRVHQQVLLVLVEQPQERAVHQPELVQVAARQHQLVADPQPPATRRTSSVSCP